MAKLMISALCLPSFPAPRIKSTPPPPASLPHARPTLCHIYMVCIRYMVSGICDCITPQATNLAKAVEEVNRMRRWRLSDRPIKPDEDDDLKDPEVRARVKATIFFSYTSNMVSCGVRETLRFLAQHKMVDCIVTSAGGIGAFLFFVSKCF